MYRRIFRLARCCRDHDVARQSAALAYYLLFSLFPFLILVSSLIAQLDLDPASLLAAVAPILPEGVLALTGAYLDYVSENTDSTLLLFSLVFSVWFPMRATDCLMCAVRRAYGLPAARGRISYVFRVFFYTVLLLFSIALALFIMTLGRRLGSLIPLPRGLTVVWRVARFLLPALIVFAALSTLYAAAQDRRQRARVILPGAALSTLSWLVLSALYAFYAEYISNYSLIYGALSTVVVLMIWLYLTAAALIVGAEINLALLPAGDDRQQDRTH